MNLGFWDFGWMAGYWGLGFRVWIAGYWGLGLQAWEFGFTCHAGEKNEKA